MESYLWPFLANFFECWRLLIGCSFSWVNQSEVSNILKKFAKKRINMTWRVFWKFWYFFKTNIQNSNIMCFSFCRRRVSRSLLDNNSTFFLTFFLQSTYVLSVTYYCYLVHSFCRYYYRDFFCFRIPKLFITTKVEFCSELALRNKIKLFPANIWILKLGFCLKETTKMVTFKFKEVQ